MEGAIIGGILNDAKIVILSLIQNNAYDIFGMVGPCFEMVAVVEGFVDDETEALVVATVTAGA